jgi:hypothetical protein
MPKQQNNPHATPAQPTRERALYVSAARVYLDAFRVVFVDPVIARRRFRRAAEWDQAGALAALLLHPDEFGPRCVRAFASAVRDPAFIYWTQRERRPRAFLIRVAELLYAEDEKRAHTERMRVTRREAEQSGHRSGTLQEDRARSRRVMREAFHKAAEVYTHPARACRAILRCVRRHGAERTRAVLEQKPDFFGALRVVKHPRGVWPLLLVFDSTDEAKASVKAFRDNGFDPAIRVRSGRSKAGEVLRTSECAASYFSQLKHLTETEPPSGALAEAARLLAVLCRRRDVDEPPQGKGPPPIYKQLSAMLPDRMAGLIVEALKLAKNETGESPEWNRGRDGYGRELARSLGLEFDFVSRGWDRSRGGGMEL